MSGYVSIADMIEFMVVESQRVMRGTYHEDDWFFYHDALSLMTATSTIEWMKKKDYLRRWLLPMNQLGADDKDLKAYMNRPVGNSPEMMPWDCSLNKDLKDAVMRHVCYTCHLPEDDERKVLPIDSQAWLLCLPTNPGARRWRAEQHAKPPGYRDGLPIDQTES